MSVAESVVDVLLEGLEEKLPYWLEQFEELDENTIRQVAQEVDPTPNKVYTVWLLTQVRDGKLTPNNMGQVREMISTFDRYKKRGDWRSQKDINRFTTPDELSAAVREYTGERKDAAPVKSAAAGKRLVIRRLESAEEIFNASQKTAWCTKTSNMAKRYADSGPLFLVLKDNRPYVMVQPRKGQVRNIHDKSISAALADEIAPLLKSSISKNLWQRMTVLSPEERQKVMQRREQFFNSIKTNFLANEAAKLGSQEAAQQAWEDHAQRFRAFVSDPPEDLALEKNISLGLEGGMLRLYQNLGLVTPPPAKADPAHNPWNRNA